jgi:DNA-binding transcriptional LysR family regulator
MDSRDIPVVSGPKAAMSAISRSIATAHPGAPCARRAAPHAPRHLRDQPGGQHTRPGPRPSGGSIDLAIVGSRPPFRPPDTESPQLEVETLTERGWYLAVPATHPLAAADVVDVGELRGQRWIASPSTDDQPRLGVWPGLDERPEIAHSVRAWMAKLNLVAAGCGMTTLPCSLVAAVSCTRVAAAGPPSTSPHSDAEDVIRPICRRYASGVIPNARRNLCVKWA